MTSDRLQRTEKRHKRDRDSDRGYFDGFVELKAAENVMLRERVEEKSSEAKVLKIQSAEATRDSNRHRKRLRMIDERDKKRVVKLRESREDAKDLKAQLEEEVAYRLDLEAELAELKGQSVVSHFEHLAMFMYLNLSLYFFSTS